MPLVGAREGSPRRNPQKETIIWNINPKKTAMLVVDMQNCFVDPAGELYVPGIQRIIPNINRLADFCRQAGSQVVWIRECVRTYPNDWKPYFAIWNGVVRRGNPMGPETGAPGTKLHQGLKKKEGDLEVVKNRYSPFAPNSPSTPPLDKLLRAQGIDTTIITGTTTDVCCLSTAIDAMNLDYRVIFVSDAIGTSNRKAHQFALDTIRLAFGMVCTTDELMEEMARKKRARTGRA